ncbi:MAG TPA: hypothetical protein VEW03_05205 [Longimicrobiaceae bacterium]|nr:hypothetical protein [Longimicrobiaceae bacterium]
MRYRATAGLKAILAMLLLVPAGGCLVAAAAAAGAGAGAGIYLTTQGAEGIVDGTVDAVAGRVPAVLEGLGVRVTGQGSEEDGAVREWHGWRGEVEIRVRLRRESATTTRVSASARESTVEWDKDFARTIVQRIVAAPR